MPPPADATRSDLPPAAPSYQSASQPPPADRPAFGPQYAYQYGQQYGGAAPGPGWPGEAPTQARNGVGITALILGILTIIAFWIPFVSILLALAAIIFGIIGLRRVSKRIANNRAMPIIGIVLGVIGGILGTPADDRGRRLSPLDKRLHQREPECVGRGHRAVPHRSDRRAFRRRPAAGLIRATTKIRRNGKTVPYG